MDGNKPSSLWTTVAISVCCCVLFSIDAVFVDGLIVLPILAALTFAIAAAGSLLALGEQKRDTVEETAPRPTVESHRVTRHTWRLRIHRHHRPIS